MLNIKRHLMLYGFAMVKKTPYGDKVVSLEEHHEELIKYRDKKYLENQIKNMEEIIATDKLYQGKD